MKKLIVLTIFLLGPLLYVSAQSRVVEKTFSVEPDKKVLINLRFGESISVKSWSNNEVAFKAVIEINNGKLNDALELDFKSDTGLEIASDYDKEKLRAGRREDCPEQYSHYSWNSKSDGENYAVCSKINYELWVPEGVDLTVESISADIELVGLAGPVKAKSISGFVDLSWASQHAADINIKTISGEAFTDLDNLNLENKKAHVPLVGYELKGIIGIGGPKVSLESVSGNIYLRKVQ
jgi:hypothetical protein